MVSEFQNELQQLINRHSMENGSNTPDFILAEYMMHCLYGFNIATTARDLWYAKDLKIDELKSALLAAKVALEQAQEIIYLEGGAEDEKIKQALAQIEKVL